MGRFYINYLLRNNLKHKIRINFFINYKFYMEIHITYNLFINYRFHQSILSYIHSQVIQKIYQPLNIQFLYQSHYMSQILSYIKDISYYLNNILDGSFHNMQQNHMLSNYFHKYYNQHQFNHHNIKNYKSTMVFQQIYLILNTIILKFNLYIQHIYQDI